MCPISPSANGVQKTATNLKNRKEVFFDVAKFEQIEKSDCLYQQQYQFIDYNGKDSKIKQPVSLFNSDISEFPNQWQVFPYNNNFVILNNSIFLASVNTKNFLKFNLYSTQLVNNQNCKINQFPIMSHFQQKEI